MDNYVLAIKEVAKYLKVNPRTVLNFVCDEELQAFKVGKDWRILKTELQRWVLEQITFCQASLRDGL